MKVRLIFCFISILIVAALIMSCGESGETTAKTVTPLDKSINDEGIKVTTVPEIFAPEIDFAVAIEEIRALHKSHNAVVNMNFPKEVNKVMEFRLDSGSVLMAHSFFGNPVSGRTRQKMRALWTGIFKRKNRWNMETKIETVRIERKRGQLAAAEGTFKYVANQTLPLKALYQMDKEGFWKIKAIDCGDSSLIKGFKLSG